MANSNTNTDKRSRIVDEARTHFGRFGFAKATMDEIAAGLGIVKGGLYYYFPTKESLFAAVVVEDQHAFTQAVAAMLAEPGLTPEEKLCRYVGMRLHFFRTMVNLSYHDEHSWGHISGTMKELFQTFEQTELQYISRIMQEGDESGAFDHERAARAAELLLHLLQGMRLRFLRGRHGPFGEADFRTIEEEVQLFLDTFLFGLVRRPSTARNQRS